MPRLQVWSTPLCVCFVLLGCANNPAGSETNSGESSGTTGNESGGPSETETETETETTGEELCLTNTPAELAACVDRDLYLADLEFIAQPREPGSPHWQAVQ